MIMILMLGICKENTHKNLYVISSWGDYAIKTTSSRRSEGGLRILGLALSQTLLFEDIQMMFLRGLDSPIDLYHGAAILNFPH